ncbi:hypothetical protein EYF80_040260 [Liparis tanakae]|uniref:Secreted protein n=1 Tax=Liparis tanakae TaxID=230148 RepID=A0A4Z2G7Q1_9TELE|nr:hypothetical protein EYF80_040260 [Liparis tanakae]
MATVLLLAIFLHLATVPKVPCPRTDSTRRGSRCLTAQRIPHSLYSSVYSVETPRLHSGQEDSGSRSFCTQRYHALVSTLTVAWSLRSTTLIVINNNNTIIIIIIIIIVPVQTAPLGSHLGSPTSSNESAEHCGAGLGIHKAKTIQVADCEKRHNLTTGQSLLLPTVDPHCPVVCEEVSVTRHHSQHHDEQQRSHCDFTGKSRV